MKLHRHSVFATASNLGAAAAFLCLTLAAARLPAQVNYPFQNPKLGMEARIDNIISLMTQDEKIDLLRFRTGVPRLGIPPLASVEGLHGEATGGPSNWGHRNPHPTTIFPQAIGLGETWDTAALHRVGEVESYEARFQWQRWRRGGLVVFAPNCDIGRDPRWGRTEECFGEDPYFNGTMAVAMIQGLQGDDPKCWRAASLMKHFFANSNEDGREKSSSNFDEQLFREYYSVAFRVGIEEGGARCLMTAYNAWNGIPCIVQPAVRNIAMKEWGLDGIVCTDGGAYRDLVLQHQYITNWDEAAAACLKAGINHFLDNYRAGVGGALSNGLISDSDLNATMRGPLRMFIRVGLLDTNNPYAGIGAEGETEPWLTPGHRAAVRELTRESIVLLKNQGNLLPLDKKKIKSIAVIGPLANQVLLDLYSGTPAFTNTPLDGIREAVGPGVTVLLATNNDHSDAAWIARKCDVAIVCVGNNPIGVPGGEWLKVSDSSEGREAVDRQTITLPEEDLIKTICAANPRTIIALISSFPYAINWTKEHAPAIVHLTHCSEAEGEGLADVLFGDYNPAGRLVETWPRSLDQLPPMMDYNIRHGRTYMYFIGEPLYPFGYGLSYTTFQYSRLQTSSDAMPRGGMMTVSVDVRNTGKMAGDEVAQFYVKHLNSAVGRPLQELRGFKRVHLDPGERATVVFPLTARSLAYWDAARQSWIVERGEKIELRVGASSADCRLKTQIAVE